MRGPKVPSQDGEGLPLAAAAERLRRHAGRPRKEQSPESTQARQGRALLSAVRNSAPYDTGVPALCPITPRLLDLSAAALYLSVSAWTVRDLEAAGVLPRVRIPLPDRGELRRVLFDKDDLDRLIAVWKDPVS